MTETDALAIVTMNKKVNAAVDACLDELSDRERKYALSYWASYIRSAAGNSEEYGCAPFMAANEIVNP